jgi:hypothetical protein
VHAVVDEELRPSVMEVALPLAVVVNLDAVRGLAAAALPQIGISHLLAFHRVCKLGRKAEEVLGPGKHRDDAGGPPLGRDVGRRLERRFLRPKPRRTIWRRGRRVRPRESGGGGPEGSQGPLVLVARWTPTAAGRRRSGSRYGRGFLPAPPRTARPPFLWDARITGSPGRPGRGGSGRSTGGCGRKGLQGFLVVAPLRATTLPRCGRRRLRRQGLPLAFFWDPVTTGGGTAEGRHDRAGLGEDRLEARGEVGMCPRPRARSAFKEER